MKAYRILILLLVLCFCCCGGKQEMFQIQPPSVKPATQQTEKPGDGQTPPEGNEQNPPEEQPQDPPQGNAPAGPVIVGYATYWDSTMPDPAYLTHINYAFAHIKKDFQSLDIKTPARLTKIAALKQSHPGLKVVLSIGGWEAGNFSEMAADKNHRKKFCENCLAAVEKYNLDGIDLDWEYPTSDMAGISASDDDTENFTLLVKDLRSVLGEDRLVTMASSADAQYVDFRSAVPYMDFVNIMTYDMGHPPYHNAGLYPSSKTKLSCDESVRRHIAAGVPAEKIVLGIPFYGHGNGNECADYVDFNEISYKNLSRMWDNASKVPYLVNSAGKMVLTYDDAESVGLKAAYVKEKGLLGAMYWNIEADDANWTLSKAIAAELIGWTEPVGGDNPDVFLATNPYVETFLEEVEYTDTEYKTTRILDYPGGGPGVADIPPVYTISWTASSSGSQQLRVWEGSWIREYSLPAGTSSQEITNLVPGTTYQWKVTSGDATVARGSFDTRGLLHQVFFKPNVRNARDLGGRKGLNGKTVAFRKLYRGGLIDRKYCDSDGRKEMLAEGIRADLDLREPDDTPSKSPLGDDIAFFAPGFESGYNHMVRDNPDKVRDCFMWVVARLRENKPVYFHCWSGRDRTGTMAVLLLGALGVSESDMAKDYELTYFSPPDWSMYQGSYQHTRNNYSYPSIRETIFKQTQSGTYQERIAQYLLQIGVPQKDLDDFRSIMLQ